MVYIASDHRGLEVKAEIVQMCKELGIFQTDLGPLEYVEGDDYPGYAFMTCERVLENPDNRAILICGTGGGMLIAANKVKGIRAAEAASVEEAALIRSDDDANVLVLSLIAYEHDLYKEMIDVWYHTPFSNEERHVRRLKMISDYENSNGNPPGTTGI